MAVRRATREYGSIVEFLQDHAGNLGRGVVLLPVGSLHGEPSPELKLDLVIPPLGRLGPIDAQVIHRGEDGSVALRIPEWPPAVGDRIDALLRSVKQLEEWFVATRVLVRPDQAAAMAAAVAATVAGGGQGGEQAPRRAGRGFPVPDLRGQSPTLSGRLGEDLQEALVRIAAERSTGLLTLRQAGGQTRYGFWSLGGPVGFRSEPLDETEVLGVLLYKAGQLTREQLRESLTIMQREGCRQGEAFIEMNVMTFPQLVMVLGKQTEFILQKILKETEGEWTFHALEQLPERFLPTPLKVPAMLFRTLYQQAREMKSDLLYTSLKDYLDRYIHVPEGVAALLPEMRFSALELRLIETIQNSSWRVRELYAVSPLSRALTAAMLHALIHLHFVGFRAEQDDARANATLQVLIDRKKVQAYSGNHFDLLEVHWICLTEEVEAAYQRLRQEYAPGRFSSLDEGARGDLQRILQRMDEAYATLRDEQSRRNYRRTVVEDGKVTQSAELLSRQGDMALMRQDKRAAVACYAKAQELVPANAEYRQGLMKARALA